MGCLDHAFENKKITVGLLITWMCIALIGFQSIDMFHSDFFHVGPSEKTKLMALSLNSWTRWWMVAIASFVSTCINDFSSDSLIPFIQNCVQDHKTKYIPYSKWTIYVLLQLYSLYASFASVISISLMMSQIDFILIRLAADLLINSYTTWKFLKNKEVNYRLYQQEGHGMAEVMEMTEALGTENEESDLLKN